MCESTIGRSMRKKSLVSMERRSRGVADLRLCGAAGFRLSRATLGTPRQKILQRTGRPCHVCIEAEEPYQGLVGVFRHTFVVEYPRGGDGREVHGREYV